MSHHTFVYLKSLLLCFSVTYHEHNAGTWARHMLSQLRGEGVNNQKQLCLSTVRRDEQAYIRIDSFNCCYLAGYPIKSSRAVLAVVSVLCQGYIDDVTVDVAVVFTYSR